MISDIYIHSPKVYLNNQSHDSCFNACRGMVLAKTISWTPNWMSEWGKKGDLSNFERGMVVGVW